MRWGYRTVWPWIIEAKSVHRKTTALAMSCGATNRPAGVRRADSASSCSRLGKCLSASVSTVPPETALTRTPRGANSAARCRTIDSSAAFEAPTAV